MKNLLIIPFAGWHTGWYTQTKFSSTFCIVALFLLFFMHIFSGIQFIINGCGKKVFNYALHCFSLKANEILFVKWNDYEFNFTKAKKKLAKNQSFDFILRGRIHFFHVHRFKISAKTTLEFVSFIPTYLSEFMWETLVLTFAMSMFGKVSVIKFIFMPKLTVNYVIF